MICFPTVLWLSKVLRFGVRRGSREFIRRLAETFEKDLPIYANKFGKSVRDLVSGSFHRLGYNRLPKLLRIFLILFWWAIPAGLSFYIYQGGTETSTTAKDMLHAIRELFPQLDSRKIFPGVSDDAVFMVGCVISMGIFFFVLELLAYISEWLTTLPRVEIKLTVS